jgi:hypothetical protein
VQLEDVAPGFEVEAQSQGIAEGIGGGTRQQVVVSAGEGKALGGQVVPGLVIIAA